MEKIYHIYAGNRCLFQDLKKEDFDMKWKDLNNMIGIMHTTYEKKDLFFEEHEIDKG